MKIEQQIKGLRKLADELSKITLTVTQMFNGSYSLRFGEKYVIVHPYSEEWALKIKAEFEVIIERQIDTITRVVTLLEERCEELTLPLFEVERKGHDGNSGMCMGETPGSGISDSMGEDQARTVGEHPDGIPGGDGSPESK